MAQLEAFLAWCKEAMECLQAMQRTDDEDGTSATDGNGSSGARDDDEDEKALEERLMVNNTVVDNELGGTDVTVKVSWRKVWEGLKKRELKPISWLETEARELCTMRWASAFLCGVGDKWCGNLYERWLRPAEALSSFYSFEMYFCRQYLRQVTIDLEEEGCTAMLDIDEQEEEGADRCQIAAYGYNESNRFQVREFESYSFENESLRSSYPALEANNREKAVAGLADSVIMVKQVGVEKLSMMRRHFERYRLPTNGIWRKAMQLFLEQCDITPKDDSPLHQMFYYLEIVPLPYQLQMVSLWEECRNWRLLQASAHCDIYAQVVVLPRQGQEFLFEMEPLPTNVFEYCRGLVHADIGDFGFVGVSMETVRTFLGEWVLFAPDVVDWEPSIPTTIFEFSTSFRFTSCNKTRIIWECQRGLQRELAKKSTAHANMSSSAELMMLFILSMPVLRVEEVVGEEENGNVSNETGAVSGGEHSSVNMSVMVFRVYSRLAPQDVSIFVRCNTETRRASLSLWHNGADGRFKWEYWVNTSMGCMKGFYERRKELENLENIEYDFRKVDLRKPMVELSPFYCGGDDSWAERSPFDSDNEDRLKETGIVRVWMGWPAFDVRICKFEVDQWLRACNIDINNIEFYGQMSWKVDEEIGRAAETNRKVNEIILFDEDDDMSEDNGISRVLQ